MTSITHAETFTRPWGNYTILSVGENFQVKKLILNPGAKLSLQLHNRRSEHWVVVAGEAEVVLGEEILNLMENQSVYIPAKTKHRLGNTGNKPLEVIEVQYGDYFGEDDIVRFEDIYGRTNEK
jgi:mannose-6-phosphate isomerase-like protein (cupin superfamily)